MEEKDDRPLIADLLQEHASDINELRSILEKEDSYSKKDYDELWMLRFLLSHKKVSKASAAAINTMNFREERKMNDLGDIRHKLLDYNDPQSERYFDIHKKFMTFTKSREAMMYSLPDPDRGILQIIIPSLMDMDGIVKNMSHEEVLECYLMSNEIIYQTLDSITRRTGKLTKVLRILDLSDFPISSFNAEYMKRDAAANKELEDFYPQLLGTVVYVNPPRLLSTLWKICKPLFPKRFLEKLAIVAPLRNQKDVKYFLRYVTKDNLYIRYGGDNTEWPPRIPSYLWEK